MRAKKLDTALNWIRENREKLLRNNNKDLMFNVHRLKVKISKAFAVHIYSKENENRK